MLTGGDHFNTDSTAAVEFAERLATLTLLRHLTLHEMFHPEEGADSSAVRDALPHICSACKNMPHLQSLHLVRFRNEPPLVPP